MKLKTILFFWLVCLSAFAQVAPYPLPIDSQTAIPPDLEMFQANKRVVRITFTDGGAVLNGTNCTPFLWWSTSEHASGIVTASVVWVTASNGIADATFTPAMLNTNGQGWVYGAGVLDAGGNPLVYEHGSFRIRPDPFATGAGAIIWTTNTVNLSLYTFTGTMPAANISGLQVGVTGTTYIAGYTYNSFVSNGVYYLGTNAPAGGGGGGSTGDVVLATLLATNTENSIRDRAYADNLTNGIIGVATQQAAADAASRYVPLGTKIPASTNADVAAAVSAGVSNAIVARSTNESGANAAALYQPVGTAGGTNNGLASVLTISRNAGGLTPTNVGGINFTDGGMLSSLLGGELDVSAPTALVFRLPTSAAYRMMRLTKTERYLYGLNGTNYLDFSNIGSFGGGVVGNSVTNNTGDFATAAQGANALTNGAYGLRLDQGILYDTSPWGPSIDWGQRFLENNGSTNLDWGNRILTGGTWYASTDATGIDRHEVVNWGAMTGMVKNAIGSFKTNGSPVSSWVNDKGYVTNGQYGINGSESKLYEGFGALSIDLYSRKLFKQDGSTLVLDWQNNPPVTNGGFSINGIPGTNGAAFTISGGGGQVDTNYFRNALNQTNTAYYACPSNATMYGVATIDPAAGGTQMIFPTNSIIIQPSNTVATMNGIQMALWLRTTSSVTLSNCLVCSGTYVTNSGSTLLLFDLRPQATGNVWMVHSVNP